MGASTYALVRIELAAECLACSVENLILMNRGTTWSDEVLGPLVKSDRWCLCFRRDRLGYGFICTYQNVLIVSGDNEG
jgi:hypothetical protein